MSLSSTAADLSVTVNGQAQSVPSGLTVAGLLETLEVTTRHVAVELNGRVVPRGEHATRVLSSDDQLEIVTLVGGG